MGMLGKRSYTGWLIVLSAIGFSSWLHAEEAAQAPPASAVPDVPAEIGAEPEGFKRLAKDYELWIDTKRHLVVVDGEICLREGFLEMFACPQGTKEHESIVAVNSNAAFVHAALIAVGAKPGRPVQFQPEYKPATGTPVDVFVFWTDDKGKAQKLPAQHWIRHTKTKEPMKHTWVFAGSGFWKDETTGERYYMAEAGDLICVSNFPSATLDLPVQSSQENAELLFEAFTERIPPLGTKVRLVLAPRLPKSTDEPNAASAATPKRPAR